MIERKADRRKSVSSHFTQPMHEQRRPGSDRRQGDRRACAAPLIWESPMPGAIRPGVGEAAPVRERRRVPESGME